MKIVLDTNVLLACIYQKSPYFNIWKSFINGRISISITTDILLEYSEILTKFYDFTTSELVLNQFNLLDNVLFIQRYFEWDLIKNDVDDNKFVDCAIASNADYIISNDKHFKILKSIPFPSVKVLSAEEFLTVLEN